MAEDLFPPFQEELNRVAGERTAQAFGQQVLAGIQSQAAADIMAQRLDTLTTKFNEARVQLQEMDVDLANLRAQVDAANAHDDEGPAIDPYITRAMRADDVGGSFHRTEAEAGAAAKAKAEAPDQ